MSHLDDAPFRKATAQGNVKGQRSRGDALSAGDEGSHSVLSSQVAISGLVLSTTEDSCISKGTRLARQAARLLTLCWRHCSQAA